MLLRFRVENHASLLDEQELSLVATDGPGDVVTAAVPGTTYRALPVAAVFGANASGKSNTVDALAHMRYVVLESHRQWPPDGSVRRDPFLLCAAGRERPSVFVVDVVVDGVRYEYGFALDDVHVAEEWLYSYPERRRRVLFERDSEGHFRYGSTFTGRRKVIEDIVRPNSLYLSAGASNNHPLLKRLYRWFHQELRVATDGNYASRFRETVQLWESGERERIEALLRFADLGVESLEVSELPADGEDIRRLIRAWRVLNPDQDEETITGELKYQLQVRLTHRGSGGPVAFEAGRESSGTQTWAGLLGPVVSTLSEGALLVVDELDARLHPLLAARLVGLFQDAKTNPRHAQLIFNTHDATLLAPHSGARLRRDQVWVAEKSAVDDETHTAGATDLVPLVEYRPRGQVENLEKRYLAGRYGGLPFFDDELLERFTTAGRERDVDIPAS